MQEHNTTILTFLDHFLNVPEAKVTYLTRVTAIDRVIDKLFLRFFPDWVTPNQITKFRLVSIPFIAIFLALDYYAVGSALFVCAALSDALDGALARTRRRITTWGMLYDPLADKLLIGSVAIITISKYISGYLALGIIATEILLVLSAYFRYRGRIVPAKTVSKTKMILQCLGVIFLLIFILSDIQAFLVLATYTLYLALIFGLLTLFVFRSI